MFSLSPRDRDSMLFVVMVRRGGLNGGVGGRVVTHTFIHVLLSTSTNDQSRLNHLKSLNSKLSDLSKKNSTMEGIFDDVIIFKNMFSSRQRVSCD